MLVLVALGKKGPASASTIHFGISSSCTDSGDPQPLLRLVYRVVPRPGRGWRLKWPRFGPGAHLVTKFEGRATQNWPHRLGWLAITAGVLACVGKTVGVTAGFDDVINHNGDGRYRTK
jgi:hypothetical protein